eukprot:TRINITY_DN1097_c0_g1_i1.p1 TRINITY_DN1097_c0_g1~~TRINITY_DN1097_c0_g1_i1.p1  ORF type:complete len:159 (-),score=47.05 TRINITY_DN1097_c0_g1_i1:21-452(-)
MALRSQVLSAYKGLLRAKNTAFKGDFDMLSAAGSQIRSEFNANRNTNNPDEIQQLLQVAREAKDFISQAIVQGVMNEQGAYDVKLSGPQVDPTKVNVNIKPISEELPKVEEKYNKEKEEAEHHHHEGRTMTENLVCCGGCHKN